MGNPNQYSIDVPARCLDLLQSLLPIVEADDETAAKYGGPLTTTLTLALATPMLVMPVERIQKHLSEEAGYANDRPLSPELAERIDAATRGKKLGDHPAFAALDWAYLERIPPFNIALGLKDDLAEALATKPARDAALAMDFAAFLSSLRNGLSHGGILYLNDDGRSSYGQASMLCFVSARQDYSRPECDKRSGSCPPIKPTLKDLRLLRIPEVQFREFLTAWVYWLNETGLEGLVNE